MSLLKEAREGASLDFFGSFSHWCGPKYLLECFPNLTVLNFGNSKSELLKRYHMKATNVCSNIF